MVVFDDAEAVAREAAAWVERAAALSLADRGSFKLSLAGGSTPARLYARLADAESDVGGEKIDWSRTHLFFGDERRVPPEHPESNYRMVRATLLDRAPIPPAHVHRMRGEEPDGSAAAAAYEAELELPLDLALLGIGPDGHTASLFPGQAAVSENLRTCVAVPGPSLGAVGRLTLTNVVWRGAREILFLVTGPEKAAILDEIVRGAVRSDASLPAQIVARRTGPVTILCDRAAAAHRSVAP